MCFFQDIFVALFIHPYCSEKLLKTRGCKNTIPRVIPLTLSWFEVFTALSILGFFLYFINSRINTVQHHYANEKINPKWDIFTND